MHLTKLTISGFKSFAKKSELQFSAPITAIVGPNGSGKSNVAEAFRFVLGEQSVKSMRGKRGEDLIWGGSESVSRGNRASVTVTLNNSSRLFPLDFDEIIVERVVHRDGQNEYSVNNSKVRLKDVQELLAAANIGSTGHHIISQGEADRILSANLQERREMIEDALGLRAYQYKKNDALKKLEKTQANIDQVQSLRREIAPHLKYLEKQVKKVERTREIKEELIRHYSEYLKREDTYIAHHYDRLSHTRKTPHSRLEAVKEELVTAKNKVKAAEESNDTGPLDEIEEKLNDIREERQSLLREVGNLEGKVSFIRNRISKSLQRSETQATRAIPHEEVSTAFLAIEKEVSVAIKNEDVAVLRRALNNIVHKLKLLLTQASKEQLVNTEVDERELKEMERALAEKQERLEIVQKSEAGVVASYEELQSNIKNDANESREAERAVFTLINEQRELENEIERIDNELATLLRDREEFKRELQEAVALIGAASSQYYRFVILDEHGNEVTNATIVQEPRQQQKERQRALEKLKVRLEELGIGNAKDVIKEYEEVHDRDEFLAREITDLEESVHKLQLLIDDLNKQLNEQFVTGLEKISAEFNRFFVLMFGGGSAKLTPVSPKPAKNESDDVEDEVESEEETNANKQADGIELDVKLPNKRVKGLEMLSGGERALTSIALIFAMSQVNPPLFIILDETDAALDEANSRRYGDMIEALAERSQLILITHNRETMSRAGILYGVTMGADGVSKLLSVKFQEAVAVAK